MLQSRNGSGEGWQGLQKCHDEMKLGQSYTFQWGSGGMEITTHQHQLLLKNFFQSSNDSVEEWQGLQKCHNEMKLGKDTQLSRAVGG